MSYNFIALYFMLILGTYYDNFLPLVDINFNFLAWGQSSMSSFRVQIRPSPLNFFFYQSIIIKFIITCLPYTGCINNNNTPKDFRQEGCSQAGGWS